MLVVVDIEIALLLWHSYVDSLFINVIDINHRRFVHLNSFKSNINFIQMEQITELCGRSVAGK